jgi:hypothetical protein
VQDQEALVADTTRTWSDKREEWENREQDIKAVLSSTTP